MNRKETEANRKVLLNDNFYTHQDWAEVKIAKETTKVNPEGERIRLKIIERNKCLDTSQKTQTENL